MNMMENYAIKESYPPKSNDKPMPQQSKLVSSRDDWKDTAVQQANEIRELKKTKRRLNSQIQALKIQNSAKNEMQKKHPEP